MCFLQETHFRSKDTNRLKLKGWEKTVYTRSSKKRAGVAILISDKINCKSKHTKRDKEGHYILIKRSIHQEDITSVNVYTPNNRTTKYTKQVLKELGGLPWWRSGWESACQCRGHGLEPWSGKIPHATEQLGPWATITEPARLEPVLRNKRGRNGERSAHRDEEWSPLAATRESPRTETKTQHSHK